MDELTQAEAAYIAGFVDGEGTINVLRVTQRFLVEMSVGQIDRRPLDFLRAKMGGTLCMIAARPEKNKRPFWVYKLGSGERFDFYVPQLLPYLIIKRRKAEIALEMRARLRLRTKLGRRACFRIENQDGENIILEGRVKTALARDEFDLRMEIVRRAAAEQALWGLH